MTENEEIDDGTREEITTNLAKEMSDDKQKIDELNDLLEKEKQKSLRLLADYQNLEKQIIDKIN